jgi:alanyl-tRNA synthetase
MAMTRKTAEDIRQCWTEFWLAKQHTVVPSASLIPTHPSAPMFTNSGMMQFVTYFLGEEKAPFDPARATSVQKCVRAGGKHNDLDAIGRSLRHLSFFEMLGNFSFGDYFKHDAITWAWEFVTGELGIDADRIWVTVHLDDDEAARIWNEVVGVPAERIQRLGKDNFWEMGETGPCGPCSELFYDFGPEFGPDGGPENPEAESRYIEFWNLVFTQFFRNASGHLTPLVNKCVDTGAGLERIAGLLDGSPSLYTCDTLGTLVDKAEEITGRRIGDDPQSDVALRLLADHARSMTFLIADGVIPSNEDRGYVLRRIIRRAVRFAYLLGVSDKVTPTMAAHVIDTMGAAYPEIAANRDLVLRILEREEAQFRRTLMTGLSILENELSGLEPGAQVSGAVAFQLHDTYGFPLEVTQEILTDRGYDLDIDGFHADMADQKARGRAAKKRTGVRDEQVEYQRVLDASGPTVFTGREELTSQARVLAVLDGKKFTGVFLDRTPFYAEQGGQIGDTGVLVRESDGAELVVEDTVNVLPGLHLHQVVTRADVAPLAPGDVVSARVDAARRAAIRRNHTGTHLLHWALREVLGNHAKQQGSYVGPDRLRFDFSHFGPLSVEERTKIEDLVNLEILKNSEVRHFETTQEEALALGAIAFFGEKYGDRVRVLEAGDHSLELCGGTHVSRLGDIGSLKVVSEGSIGSNLRRVEAVTGLGTLHLLRDTEATLAEAAQALGSQQGQLLETISRRTEELRSLGTEAKLQDQLAELRADKLVRDAVSGVLVTRIDGLDPQALRTTAVLARERGGLRAVVIGGVADSGRPSVAVSVDTAAGLDASTVMTPIAKGIRGGFGRHPETVLAGGRDAEGLDEILAQSRSALVP